MADIEVEALFSPDVVEDPHAYYRQLRDTDPVHGVDGTGTYVVTTMALIHQVVADTDTFSSATGEFLHLGDWPRPELRPAMTGLAAEDAGGAIATSDPPDHGRQRKMVVRRLSTSNIQAMEPQFRTLAETALA